MTIPQITITTLPITTAAGADPLLEQDHSHLSLPDAVARGFVCPLARHVLTHYRVSASVGVHAATTLAASIIGSIHGDRYAHGWLSERGSDADRQWLGDSDRSVVEVCDRVLARA